MKQIIKVEYKRLIYNKRLWIAIAAGVLLAMWHMVIYVLPQAGWLGTTKGGTMLYPSSVFNSCIFNCHITLPYELFYTMLPILAILPFGDSFCWDKKSGYLKNIVTRTTKKNYYIAKYIVTFTSGMAVVMIPMLISLWSTAMLLPALAPEVVTGGYPLSDLTLWNSLYVSYPWAFTGIMILLTGIIAGLLACICLVVSLLFEKNFAVLMFPFLFYLFTKYVFEFIELQGYSPAFYLRTAYVTNGSTWIVVSEILGLFILTAGVFITKGKRNEVF